MTTNIFQPLQFGKETFIPIEADESKFVMDWYLEKGGGVPAHIHQYMDEHFAVTEGEVTFMVSGKPVVKRAGEEIMVAKNTVHGIRNASGARIGIRVTYTPASDTRRMFEILAELNAENPGSVMNMIKYFYIAPRIGLKDFSNPRPAWVDGMLKGVAAIMGAVGGWKRYVQQFQIR